MFPDANQLVAESSLVKTVLGGRDVNPPDLVFLLRHLRNFSFSMKKVPVSWGPGRRVQRFPAAVQPHRGTRLSGNHKAVSLYQAYAVEKEPPPTHRRCYFNATFSWAIQG